MNLSYLKETLLLRAFGLFKIPLIFFVGPSVVNLNDKECEVVIPLNRRTRNHLNSMYFGTLAIGADCAGGLMAMQAIKKSGKKISMVFKDFKADFLKRPEADVHFICKDGAKTQKQVKQVIQSGERVSQIVHIIATTPKISGDEPVAKFELNLSLKLQK